MDYRAPGFRQPPTFNIAQSIDSLFNAYQQDKQLQDQRARQDFEDVANYGTTTRNLTPDQLMRGAQGPTISTGLPPGLMPGAPSQTMYIPKAQPQIPLQGQPAMGTPGDPMASPVAQGLGEPQQQAQYDQDPHVEAIQRFIQMKRQGQIVGAEQSAAALSKTVGEARTANVEADLMGAPAMFGQGATPGASGPSLVSNVLEAVKAGQMSPNQADDYLGRNPKVHLAYINEIAKNKVDVATLQNEYDKKKTTANFEGGMNVQEPARLVESIKAGLPGLAEVADKAGMGDSPLWNKIKLSVDRLRGKVGSQQYITQIGEIRSQVAQVLQAHGAPAESAVHRAESMLPDDIGKAQLNAVINKDIPELIGNRADALLGKPLTKSSTKTKAASWGGGTTHTYPDGTKAQWNGKAWVKAQ